MSFSSAEGIAGPELDTASAFPLRVVISKRAKRYLLRLDRDGVARLVIPRRGSRAEGMRFFERSRGWLEEKRQRWQSSHAARQPWHHGTPLRFRGEEVNLRVEGDLFGGTLSFADQVISVSEPAADYRDRINAHLRTLAERELPRRTHELAREHGISLRNVSIRAQRTRWGSCSARGTICLNWRLIHAPPFVADYLIIHELMHRREMNHSARYWKLVAEACPRWREAEAWLKGIRIETLG